MARKSRKNMPVAVAEPTDNLTAKAVLSMDKEAKPYQVGIYARLSFESEANKERDTVDTQIAYIREFINSQDDMVEVEVYADISVTGTTFERPEFDRMIQDIRAGRINTVITRDLSRLGRNYVEAGNYIERVFPFLDVRYIAITDDFDTARPGTDLSVPLKNIVNEYYSKDLSKKVETGKHSIWAQGGFSEGTPPYGYYRATDGSRKLLIDEEVSDNVVRIFNMFLDGEGYGSIAKTMQSEGILSPPKYRFYKAGKTEFAEKAREWHYSHVKEILQGEYYIGNIVHGKQRKALDTGRKNKKTDKSKWQRVENAHEPIIDKDTFYRVQERIELIRSKHLEGSKPNPEAPKKPDNILVYKTKCACCGGSVLIGRHHTYSEKFYYKCKNRRKLARLCENKYSYDYSEVMDSVFSVIRQHMSLCVEKTKFVQKMNSRKENVLQYDIYTKQIAKLQNDVRRITANKSGLYEDYREQLITAEELCQYQREYESRVNEIEAQITELLHRRSLYEKEFHIDEGWEETVNKYMAKRKLTKELVDAFVSEIVFYDGNIEVKLLYDDFLKEFPDDCLVDFDMKLIDLFAEIDRKHLKLKDQIINEYFRVKELLGRRPDRMDFFTYMDDGIYETAIAHSKDNPFKKYLEFLKELDELNQDEEFFYKGIGREFISLLENTSMSKVYKMPVLMAFYNHGNILMEVSEEQLLSSWKEFFSTGTNWKDLDKNMTIQKYNSISDKEHLKKILSMPVHFLLESGKGFFVKKDGAAIGLREELRPLIDNPVMVCQMKDVIDYRAMDYYQRRYRQSQEDGEL